VITAARTAANTSVICPSEAVRHSSIETRRSSTSRPCSLAKVRIEERVILEDRPGQFGGDQAAVGVHEIEVHPAEFLDPAPFTASRETDLVTAVRRGLHLGASEQRSLPPHFAAAGPTGRRRV